MMKIQNLHQAECLAELAAKALENEIPADKIALDKIRKACVLLLDNRPDLYHTIATDDDDKIIAFFIGCLHEGAFDNQVYATEISAYVEPAHRDTTIADAMLKDFEQWAQDKQADVINLITFTALAKPLRARGYESSQSLFHKPIGGA